MCVYLVVLSVSLCGGEKKIGKYLTVLPILDELEIAGRGEFLLFFQFFDLFFNIFFFLLTLKNESICYVFFVSSKLKRENRKRYEIESQSLLFLESLNADA